MTSPLVTALQAFSVPQDEGQLRALDAAVQAIDPKTCTLAEIRALLGVFERFPEDDGFGVFWGLLHALEACEGYESELIASVQRKPVEFNVLMIHRLLNAGTAEIDGQPLKRVLESVATNARATAQGAIYAKRFLAQHEV